MSPFLPFFLNESVPYIYLLNLDYKECFKIILDRLPMKVEPVKGFGFTEGVDGKLHQLVVAQVQRAEGCGNRPKIQILLSNMDWESIINEL